jgi:hypothetical protein
MPVRLMTYTSLFYEHLIAEGRLARRRAACRR